MRLAQITSGFVGGVETQSEWRTVNDSRTCQSCRDNDGMPTPPVCKNKDGCRCVIEEGVSEIMRNVGTEKLEAVVDWIAEHIEQEENVKLLLWCRFRREQELLHEACIKQFSDKCQIGSIIGAQSTADRRVGRGLLHPATAPRGGVIVTGTTATGNMGLNLAASHTVMYVSNDTRLSVRLQSMSRVHRPPQKFPVSYFDVVAYGPDGQKTIDHAIFKALRDREDTATWTCAAWIKKLREE